MSSQHYREQDADPKLLKSLKIAVLGYGSQGRAHAMNLHDSGMDVTVGARAGGPSAKQAAADGLRVAAPSDAAKSADFVAMLVPDMAQPALYKEAVAPYLKDGATMLFAHGFNIHFRQIEPRKTIDVSMVAPKGPGALVRRQYEQGQGVPCLVAVHQDASGRAFDRALSYAHHIGGTRAGVIRTTFAEETETDLFGEQAVLCGGVTELITACWETLVDAGYSREAAYFECMHELKLIVDLLYEGGIARMHKYVSDTAKYGDLTRGPKVIDKTVRASLKAILADIRSGAFAEEWIKESATGGANFKALLEKDLKHPIEETGRKLRERMSWLPKETGK
jgi:ketol-acid reductoisomerase